MDTASAVCIPSGTPRVYRPRGKDLLRRLLYGLLCQYICEAAGAEFAITQPVFDPDPLLRFLEKTGGLRRIPIVAGIRPLLSARNAELMKNEVPGVYVPDSVVARMSACDTKEAALEEGAAIAQELLEKLRGAISDVQLSAPLGKVRYAFSVISWEASRKNLRLGQAINAAEYRRRQTRRSTAADVHAGARSEPSLAIAAIRTAPIQSTRGALVDCPPGN